MDKSSKIYIFVSIRVIELSIEYFFCSVVCRQLFHKISYLNEFFVSDRECVKVDIVLFSVVVSLMVGKHVVLQEKYTCIGKL